MLLSKIRSDNYEKIKLVYELENYYIPIKISQKSDYDYFILSNLLPINLFPSSKCTICKDYIIDEKDNKTYSFIKNNASISYYSNNFIGDLYSSNITLGSQTKSIEFISFEYTTNTKSYKDKGLFSLSFLNYDFNTSKKIFALSLGLDNGELDLGYYNFNKIKNISNLKTFNINKTYFNSTSEYSNVWYMSFNSLLINGNKIINNNKYRLTLDVSTNYFHIPKDFFFNNAQFIFLKESKCQVQQEGYFICICNKNYKEKYGNFKFINENKDVFEVKVVDYIKFDSSSTHCQVLIQINYESDLFIAGKYVMNNYYTIFDIDNNQLKIYPDSFESSSFIQRNIIIYFISLCVGGVLFIIGYIIYKRNLTRNENLLLNEDLIRDNREEVENNNGEEIEDHQQNNKNGNNDEKDNDNMNLNKILDENSSNNEKIKVKEESNDIEINNNINENNNIIISNKDINNINNNSYCINDV